MVARVLSSSYLARKIGVNCLQLAAAGSATDMDAVTPTCDGQAKTAIMASPTQNVNGVDAAAVMEGAALKTGSAPGYEAVHDADASTPIPLLSQLADEDVQTQSGNARAVTGHLAGEVEDPQLQETHTTAQPPGAAAAQPADGDDTHPAQIGQSGHANAPPYSACDRPMSEAADQYAPSQQADAGADTNSGHELAADGGATTQLAHEFAATELAESTAHAEPADTEPVTDEGAIPMQTDLPTSNIQESPSADRHDQPQLQAMVGVEAPMTVQTQAELQSNDNHIVDAQHSTQSHPMEEMQSEPNHPALEDAGSDAMLDSEMADTNAPLEAATTDATSTLPVQQRVGAIGVMGSTAHELAQPDTDMEDATPHGDQLSEHQVPEGEPVGSNLGPSKQVLAAASEAGDQSDIGFEHAPERVRSPARQAPPPSPASLQT